MRRFAFASLVAASVLVSSLASAQSVHVPKGALLYIEEGELAQALNAAIVKKKVPVRLTTDREQAEYVMAAVTEAQSEGKGERITKVIMLGMFAGSGKSRDTSVTVTDRDGAILWAYNTRKTNFQSAAEGIAKHFKKHVEGK